MTQAELTPKEIGGFRILRRLASGAASDVLLARAEGPHGFQRVVALKILLAHPKDKPDFERTFAAEASAYARLSHPAVVKLYDFFAADGQLVMVLEYVDGLPLHKLRAMLASSGARIEDKAALYLGMRVFSALAAAHGARDATKGLASPIVHYDVNPSNILVPWDGAVKLGDFGIAHAAGIQADPRTGFIKGTYGYSAPEQVTNGPAVGNRADVYSAGLILWELLARRKAVQRGSLNDAQVLKAMAHPEFPSLEVLRPDLHPGVRTALRRALEPDPDKRTITAAEMVAVLGEAVVAEEGRKALATALTKVKHSLADGAAPENLEVTREVDVRASADEDLLDPEQTAPFAAVTDESGDLGKIAFYGRIMLPSESNAPPGPRPSPLPSAAPLPDFAAEAPTTTYAKADAQPARGPITGSPPRPVPRPVVEKRISSHPTTPAPPLEPEPVRDAPPPAAGAPAAPAPTPVVPPVEAAAPRVEAAAPPVEAAPAVAAPLPAAQEPAAARGEIPPAPDSAPTLVEKASTSADPMTERSPEGSVRPVAPVVVTEARPSQATAPALRPNVPPYVPSSMPPPAPRRSPVLGLVALALVMAAVGGGAVIYFTGGTGTSADATPAVSAPPPTTTATTAPVVPQSASAPPVGAASAPPAASTTPIAASTPAPTAPAVSAAPSDSAPAPVASAPPVASAVASAAPAASAPSPVPAPASGDTGTLQLPARAAQHRIFVDGKVAGEGTNPIQLHCGSHLVKIGSAGTEKKVDVPCGGAVSFEP